MPGPQTLQELLEKLRAAGIQLSLSGDRLRCSAPKNALTTELQEAITRWKPELIELLARPPSDTTMPLVRAPRDIPLPLSFAQQRLWVLNRMDPQSPAYNLPLFFRVPGKVDRPAVTATLTEIARRHEVLRTTFDIEQGQPTQRISSPAPVLCEECDLRSEYALEGYRAVTRLAGKELQRPLNLSTGPVWRATLVRLDETLEFLLVILHHIISDGWSLAVFRKEFEQLYPTYRDGCPAVVPELAIQYVDFAFSQRQWFQGSEFQRQLTYWTQRLAGSPAALPLPTDRERPPISTYNGATRSATLPKALSDGIKAFGQKEGSTPFITLLAVFNLLLHRYTGEEDILVGIPDGNRQLLELEPVQGLFVNTLVMRTDLSGNPSFRTLLQRVRQRVMEAYEHRDLPFESLVEALQPERNLSHPPLFQVMFVMQNTPLEEFARTAPTVPQAVTVISPARYDLTVYALETGSGLRLSLEYNTDLFDETTLARMEGHWPILIQEILDKPDQGVGSLNLLTTPERRQLLDEWNQTAQEYPRDTHLHGLIEAQVLRTPDAVAAIDTDGSLTYRELNRAANRLARRLHDLGIGPKARVAVLLPRSVELVAALLGILKAGAAYVPLDPSYPRERLEFMLTDSEVAAVLTSDANDSAAWAHPVPSITLSPGEVRSANEAWETNAESGASPDSLAYVIYTSGSTGRPKGAMIPHRGVVNYLCWCVQAYELDQGRGAPVHSSIAFDLTITALFAPLLCGKPVLMLPEGGRLEPLASALLGPHPFSLLKITPAHLDLLARLLPPVEASKAARFFIIGGENLKSESLAFWRTHAPETVLINEYGPTETVVGCCVYRVPPGTLRPGVVPIGRPIANTKLYVLDSLLQPVPVGIPGELYIGGEGVATGYLNRPQLTAERFLTNPFDPAGASRLYRTGDRVRYLADGNLECLGRIDHQIKLRGYRVEPGEIESVIKEHPSVADAAVLLREDLPGDQRLVAYLVPKPHAVPDVESLREHVRRFMPEHMCPVAWVTLASLPLTPNGKLDRRALPTPAGAAPSAREIVPPRNETEGRLIQIWREVLQVEQVGIHDNFFDLGGHSLLLVRLHDRIQEGLGVQFPLIELFRHPTIARLAELAAGTTPEAPTFAEAEDRAHRQREFLARQRETGST